MGGDAARGDYSTRGDVDVERDGAGKVLGRDADSERGGGIDECERETVDEGVSRMGRGGA